MNLKKRKSWQDLESGQKCAKNTTKSVQRKSLIIFFHAHKVWISRSRIKDFPVQMSTAEIFSEKFMRGWDMKSLNRRQKNLEFFFVHSFYRDVFTMEVPTSEMFLLELEIDWSSSNSRRFLCHVKISVKYLLIISLRFYSTKSRTIKSSSLVKVIKPKKVNFSLLNTACKTIISECSFEQFSYFLRYFCWLK